MRAPRIGPPSKAGSRDIRRPPRFQRAPRPPPGPRINDRIRIKEVRCIGADGKQVGVIPTEEALVLARQVGLDLVEIVPNERPPVVKIMDYGKYKYDQAKKERKNRAGNVELHEIRFRPQTSEHDMLTKIKKAREFLEQGDKIQFYVQFRGREMRHPELGAQLLERVVGQLGEDVKIESPISRQGPRRMLLTIAPLRKVAGQPETGGQ